MTLSSDATYRRLEDVPVDTFTRDRWRELCIGNQREREFAMQEYCELKNTPYVPYEPTWKMLDGWPAEKWRKLARIHAIARDTLRIKVTKLREMENDAR